MFRSSVNLTIFGISDGRASAFAKRDDQHVSFSNRYSNRSAHSAGPGVMGSRSLGIKASRGVG